MWTRGLRLAPGASFQPRAWPRVDILNLVLQGDAEYRDSDGNRSLAQTGDALPIAARPEVNYSEHNMSKSASLMRMQIWLDACPQRENPPLQKIAVADTPIQLLASPDGSTGSLRLRQQAWIHHLHLTKGERLE